MKTKNNTLTTLEQFKNQYYGERGCAKREELEAGYENFKRSSLVNPSKNR
ncbi:hypothetical protein [Larkinella sp. C7]|nr:hypothetical protein [Larkinella sp. C7]